MTRYLAFWGAIESNDGEWVVAAISAWVSRDGRSKAGPTGLETTWESDEVMIYAHPGSAAPGAPGLYLIEGRVPGPVVEGRARLTELQAALTCQGAPTSIDVQERDEHDADIGDLQTLPC